MGSNRYSLTLLVLIAAPLALMAYKVAFEGYRLSDILPGTEYRVTLSMSLDGQNGRVSVKTFGPESDQRQTISDEAHSSSPSFRYSSERHADSRLVSWFASQATDREQLKYSFSARLRGTKYKFSDSYEVPDTYAPELHRFLLPETNIQADAEEIVKVKRELGSASGSIRARLSRIYERTSALTSKPFKGTTDALTALRLGEASCNGKSRLFVALARSSGIPSRLVGGLILTPGTKRTSHQWAEAFVAGHWLPFDPTNRHFAELPENYLVLYRGDEALFRHSSDINFDYSFTTSTVQVPSSKITSFRLFNVWELFQRLGIPFGMLRTLLTLPIGALVVVVFRNVVGIATFGTFLPALIAAAFAETGLAWGLASMCIVTASVALARYGIQSLRLLHSPTLAILLAVVVLSMLTTSFVADDFGLDRLARVTYFPIAVMAIAAERFYLAMAEESFKTALVQMGGTLLVVMACYVVMNSLAIQVLMGAFPEVLLLVVAANVYLGRWIGIRVLEFWRFRQLIVREAEAS